MEKMAEYCGRMKLFVVPFTEIQEQIRDRCPEELFTIIMRRFMMRIACRLAESIECGGLVTGESLAQVASQTLGALRYELVRWGRHYNQGVHALNAIVYAARRKAPERDYFVQQIAVANEKLDAVEEGRRRLEGRLDGLEGSIVVGDTPCRY